MEHLALLSAFTRTSSEGDTSSFIGSLNCLDGCVVPLRIALEDVRRVLHKTGNSLIWLELDGDPHWLLAMISGDPRTTPANRLELHEVEPHEEVSVYSRVEFCPSSNSTAGFVWDVVDPWVKICGPAERVALALQAPLQPQHVLARDVTLLFRTRLMSDPEQVLFRVKKASPAPRPRPEVSVAVEGTDQWGGNAFASAAVKLIRNRMQLCRPCECAEPSVMVCLSRKIEVGTLEVAEVSACCMQTLAEADAVLAGIAVQGTRGRPRGRRTKTAAI